MREKIIYKCPNCSREIEREQKSVLILCGCGYEMTILTDKHDNPIYRDVRGFKVTK